MATTEHKGLSTAEKNDLPDSAFAFPKERKEPLTDSRHVRNAIARFDQVEDVTDAERDRAWARIKRGGEEVRRRGVRGGLARAVRGRQVAKAVRPRV